MRFSDLVEINPSVSLSKNGVYPFIEMEIISPGRRYATTQKKREYKGGGSKFQAGDTLFARITPCLENGKIAQFKGVKDEFAFGSTEFFVFRHKEGISDPAYIFYLALSDIIRKPAEKSMSGASGRQRADIASIQDLIVPAPSLPNQRKIASILSAYDDLIENNLRRIKILEELAQMIYREWFVHFRFPGHEKVKMVKSELGRIPEGWGISNLSNMANFIRGVEPGSKNYLSRSEPGTVPFIRVGDLGNRESNIFITSKLAKDKLLDENDIAITLDGTVGIVRIGLKGAYSTGIRKVEIANSEYLKWAYLYFLLQSDHIQGIIRSHAKGTTILHASSAIDHMFFPLPPFELLEVFEKIVSPKLTAMLNLAKRNDILRNTRDLLLPKLVSGEIDVEELDIKVDYAEVKYEQPKGVNLEKM